MARPGYHAIAIDLRGHGESPWSPTGDYDVRDFARDLVAVASRPKRRPALIGASLGGLAGLIAEGLLAPGTYASITLVDITPQMEAGGVARVIGFMSRHAQEGFESPEHASRAIAAYLPHRKGKRTSAGLDSYLRKSPDGRFFWHWDPAFVASVTRRREFPDDVSSASTELVQAATALSLPVHLIRGE